MTDLAYDLKNRLELCEWDLAAARQRGDCYRARALGMVRLRKRDKQAAGIKNWWRAWAREHQWRLAQYDRAEAYMARAVSAELLAAAAATLSAERDAARAEAAWLERDLRIYGRHLGDCSYELNPDRGTCDCCWESLEQELIDRAALAARAQPPAHEQVPE